MEKGRKICSQIIIFSLLMASIIFHVESVYPMDSYLHELLPGSRVSFKHWNQKRSEVTGYSHYRYVELVKDDTRFIIEKNENTKPDGEVFTRKTLWFESDSGVPKLYEEEDLREDFRILNTYSLKMMKTRLEKSDNVMEFETDLSKEQAVPFEVLIFFLRKNLINILQTKEYSFTLFLPLLALELEDKGLPRSMSMIRVLVELKEKINLDTPLGQIQGHKILISPQSGILRALIPREKTHFEFTFSAEAPHYLLEFEVGETRHILTQLVLKQ